MKRLFLIFILVTSQYCWASENIEKQSKSLNKVINPPAGRLAYVSDGNSPDPDDIAGNAVTLAILGKSGLSDRLVHFSYACDLDPFRNPISNQTIDVENELRRQKILKFSADKASEIYGPFNSVSKNYNCRTEQQEATDDLVKAINSSTENNPLWIIEAGEPDLIGYALEAAKADSIKYVHVVSHHPANDNSGDFFTWKQILDFGVNEHQIGDQNVGLQTEINKWDWAKNHNDKGIAFIWDMLAYVESDGVVKFQTNKYDCSDAGMVYWWITGASNGGNKFSTPEDIKKILIM
ncbi:hypothetical protein ACQKPX_22135 [Photobacterium sp. DNB23_23_1]